MKTLVALPLFLFLFALPLRAASQEEQDRFLTTVRQAYATKDTNALMSLYCWDGVDLKDKQFFLKVAIPGYLAKTPTSIDWFTNKPSASIPKRTFRYNLPEVKMLMITYSSWEKMGLRVGEKDGKLMIPSRLRE